ncbi:MAG: T9SS type A sorting domain-containing protein, partial [Bacteroidota bacterium]|nr:T9SS type A sorting domain-containing protein [Bacteroidota bacterium]
FTGTYGDGIWRRSLSEIITSVEQIYSHIPEKFALNQNYPNPFNPTTTIQFDLPKASFVTLKVYNVLGQEVAILVNEKREAGRYEVEFNASALSSSVYFYRLVAGDFMAVKKFILMK